MLDKIDIEELIKEHSESYIEKYEEWNACVGEVNQLLRLEYGFDYDYFTYDAFCKAFNEATVEYLTNPIYQPTPLKDADIIIIEILLHNVLNKNNISGQDSIQSEE